MLNFTVGIWMGIPGTRAKELPTRFNGPYVTNGVSFWVSWWNHKSPPTSRPDPSPDPVSPPSAFVTNSRVPYQIVLVFVTLILLTNGPKAWGCWCWQLALAREKPQSAALKWEGESSPRHKAPRHLTCHEKGENSTISYSERKTTFTLLFFQWTVIIVLFYY